MLLRLLTLLALLVAVPAPAMPVLVQTAESARRQDAGEYARIFAVDLEEAERRLRALDDSVPATDALARTYASRLAGIAVEHRPALAITVLLTGEDPVAPTTAAGIPVRFVTGAPATRAGVVAAIAAHQAEIRAALPHPPGLGADPRTGRLVVLLNPADLALDRAALERRFADLTGVAVQVGVLGREDRDTAVEGGGRLVGLDPADGRYHLCTAGFAVTDGTRDAIATAAHCPDHLQAVDADGARTDLTYVDQWGWSFRDVQLNASTEPLQPLFEASADRATLRPVDAVRPRASVRAGDFVCHRGERSGYSCAEVRLVDFAPSGDLCGGPCAPSWVMVDGPDCRNGDSGGPVFSGTTALGLLKGASFVGDGRCHFYYYMALDFLPPGWRMLTTASDEPVQRE